MSIESTGPAQSPGYRAVQAGDIQQHLRHMAEKAPITQFLRELPFNSIQACQRTGGGLVVVDHVDIGGVRKMRFWDTGDGMTRLDLTHRINQLATSDRTGHNFGVGLKLSMYKASPAGAVYITLRDGQAYLAKLCTIPETGEWAMLEVNPAGEGDDKLTAPIPSQAWPDYLPHDIVQAGHGTVVIMYGTTLEDRPWDSVAALAGFKSKRWVAEYLNSRFTHLPDGVTLRVITPDVNKDATGAKSRSDSRPIRGSIGQLEEEFTLAANQGVDDQGASGTRKLTTIPGVVQWAILPKREGRPNSTVKLGGRMRLSVDGDVGETYADSRGLTAAGIIRNPGRVELHFFPDADQIGVDVSRTQLQVAGMSADMALVKMANEFSKSLPRKLAELVADTSGMRQTDYAAEAARLHGERASVRVRSPRGALTGRSGGRLVEIGATERSLRRPGEAREPGTAAAGQGERPGGPRNPGTSSHVRTATSADGPGRPVKATLASALPHVTPTWVNLDADDVPDLTASRAGQYLPDTNTLLLNARFKPLAKEVKYWAERYRSVPNIEAEALRHVRNMFEFHMIDVVMGVVVEGMVDLLTPESLTISALARRPLNQPVGKTLGRMFNATQALFDTETDADTSLDYVDELPDDEDTLAATALAS